MNSDLSQAPPHIAAPKIPFLGKFFIVITIFFGYGFLIDTRNIPLTIFVHVMVLLLIGYRVFAFKKCPSCNRNYITKSKKYCYECWLKARQSAIAQDILNPEE